MTEGVTAVIATYNSQATLPALFESLRAQDYAGELELLCVDGGSEDATLAIARRYGARIVENPGRSHESACALGVDHASQTLLLFVDHDNELPHPTWLAQLVGALEIRADVVGADCLHHSYRRQDPAMTRLCGLIGGNDPISIELGWADRWAWHLGRWTGMPVQVETVGEISVVRVDPERPPPMGTNGFLVRREAVRATGYRPFFVHYDVVADLAAAGWRFARLPMGIVHHTAPDLWTAATKARARASRTVTNEPPRRHPFQPSAIEIVRITLSSVTLVGPALRALRGFRRKPDWVWVLYPLLHIAWTCAYVRAVVGRVTQRVTAGVRSAHR